MPWLHLAPMLIAAVLASWWMFRRLMQLPSATRSSSRTQPPRAVVVILAVTVILSLVIQESTVVPFGVSLLLMVVACAIVAKVLNVRCCVRYQVPLNQQVLSMNIMPEPSDPPIAERLDALRFELEIQRIEEYLRLPRED